MQASVGGPILPWTSPDVGPSSLQHLGRSRMQHIIRALNPALWSFLSPGVARATGAFVGYVTKMEDEHDSSFRLRRNLLCFALPNAWSILTTRVASSYSFSTLPSVRLEPSFYFLALDGSRSIELVSRHVVSPHFSVPPLSLTVKVMKQRQSLTRE